MLAQGCWRRIGQNLDGRGRKGPALWASGVSESRHWGGGRSYDLDTCGRLGRRDETSERGRLCGISLVRSSRRQPSTTECPGGDDLPQGGVVALVILSGAEQTEERTLEIVNVGTKMTGGSKLFRRKFTQALTIQKQRKSCLRQESPSPWLVGISP
jgi:hypothetical protein